MAEGWKWGFIKVDFPAEEYGLDEDGWIEVRSRVTVKDYEVLLGTGSTVLTMLPGLYTGWHLVVGGEEVEFSEDAGGELPLEFANRVMEVLLKQPFFERAIARLTGLNLSNGSQESSEQDETTSAETSGEHS